MGRAVLQPRAPRLSGATTLKPYAGFPLTPHPTGRWCKNIQGKLYYYGKLDDSHGRAPSDSTEFWPYDSTGRTRPAIDVGDGCTIKLLCNAYLTSKQAKVTSGELSPRSFRDCYTVV